MNYNLGRVLPIFKGAYDASATYKNLDVVYWDGGSYVAKGDTQGNTPDNTEYWQPVAMPGMLSPSQIEEIQEQVIEYVQAQGYVIDENYVHTDNNFTNADKSKLDGIDPGSGDTSDYTQLSNLPSINGTTLTGNVSLATPEQLAAKQDTLVSGENIATINNRNLLEGGNIEIQRGEDGQDAYNPFKGWFNSASELPPTPQLGDYAYVDVTDGGTTTTMIFKATASGWPATSTEEYNPANNPTFHTTQELSQTSIVDKPETGGVNDVASAEAVKTIYDTTMTMVYSENILDPDTIQVGYYVSRLTGNRNSVSTSTIYGCTPFIDVSNMRYITVNHLKSQSGNAYCGAVFYDENKTILDSLAIVSPSTNGNPITMGGGLTYPTRKYVRFNLAPQSYLSEGENYCIYVDKYTSTPPSVPYTPWFEPYYASKKITDTDIMDDTISLNKVAFKQVEVGVNKLNPAELAAGKAVRYTDGAVVNATGHVATGYIPASKAGLYANYGTTSSGSISMGYAVYNDNKEFIRGVSAASSESRIYHWRENTENPEAYVRFTINQLSSGNYMVSEGTEYRPYVPYTEKEVIDPEVLPATSLSEDDMDSIKTELYGDKIYTSNVDVFLPSKFYCVKGDTLQLFYKGMVKAVNIDDKYVMPTCSIGTQYKRYLEVKSNDTITTGNKSLNITVYDDNRNILGTGSSVIKVVNAPVSPSSSKHILCLGASTTAGGKWPCELQRRLLASDGTPQGKSLTNLELVGSMSKTLYGQTSHFFAKSGWAWADICTEGRAGKTFRFYLDGTDNQVSIGNTYTNNGHAYTVAELNTIDGVETILCETSATTNTPQSSGTLASPDTSLYPNLTFTQSEQGSGNPFWDTTTNSLHFQPYFDTYCGGYVDIIYTLFTANRIFADSLATQKGYIESFAQQLHTEYPNCKLVLACAGFPSMINMLPGYGASGDYHDVYNLMTKEYELFKMYKELESEYDFVECESWTAQFDADYNYPLTYKNVNTRNSAKTEPYANNTVHPGDAGYMQYADAAYRSVVAHFCQ